LLTFGEKIVAAVLKALFAAFGGNEASKSGEAGSKGDGEFDHFVGGIASILVF
jgi:hypothetical protein